MLKEYNTYDELSWMPIKDLMDRIGFFQPKFQEIARRQSQERLQAELAQKNMGRVRNNPMYGPGPGRGRR